MRNQMGNKGRIKITTARRLKSKVPVPAPFMEILDGIFIQQGGIKALASVTKLHRNSISQVKITGYATDETIAELRKGVAKLEKKYAA